MRSQATEFAFGWSKRSRFGRGALASALITALLTAGCGSAPAGPDTQRAASFEEFAAGLCAAFDSLFRAVGNPDTASGSELSNALKAAAERGDSVTAEEVATQITAELETGRGHASYAAGWPPGEAAATQVDRLLVAFERWTEAHVEAARGMPAEPQQAFEESGGLSAWQGMIAAMQVVASHRPPGVPARQCPNVPISL